MRFAYVLLPSMMLSAALATAQVVSVETSYNLEATLPQLMQDYTPMRQQAPNLPPLPKRETNYRSEGAQPTVAPPQRETAYQARPTPMPRTLIGFASADLRNPGAQDTARALMEARGVNFEVLAAPVGEDTADQQAIALVRSGRLPKVALVQAEGWSDQAREVVEALQERRITPVLLQTGPGAVPKELEIPSLLVDSKEEGRLAAREAQRLGGGAGILVLGSGSGKSTARVTGAQEELGPHAMKMMEVAPETTVVELSDRFALMPQAPSAVIVADEAIVSKVLRAGRGFGQAVPVVAVGSSSVIVEGLRSRAVASAVQPQWTRVMEEAVRLAGGQVAEQAKVPLVARGE